MTREEIIATATRIAELRQEVSRLSALQKELKQLEAQLDGIADPSSESTGDPNSLVERAVQAVNTDPVRDWTGEDVAGVLGAKLPSVRAALSKAVGIGRIVKRGRGKFGATSAQSGLAGEPVEVNGTKAA